MTGWQSPPSARSRVACAFSAAAAAGRLQVQRCEACGRFCYPAREACPACWSAELRWTDMPAGGTLLTDTTLHASFNGWFQARLPWRIGYIRADAGPVVLAHLHAAPVSGDRVRLLARTDSTGQGVLIALPEDGETRMAEDSKLRTLTCDPRNRTVLVSDVAGGAGRAVAEALLQAGAARVYGGYAGSRPETDGTEAVPLDPADEASVTRQADALGGEIDIVVCVAGPSVAGSVLDDTDAAVAERQMAESYFERLRLARAFGPALRDRAHGAEDAARAWVNLLSAHALSGGTGYGTSAAGQAAALSLSQALRAELAGSGVRVIDVFAGPLDDDANASVPPPKVRPAQLGRAVVEALTEGLERIAVGPVAEDMLQRFEASPLAFEREEMQK